MIQSNQNIKNKVLIKSRKRTNRIVIVIVIVIQVAIVVVHHQTVKVKVNSILITIIEMQLGIFLLINSKFKITYGVKSK